MKLHHFNPKREKRGLLFKVFVVVAIIQVSLLVALSSYIVSVTYFTEEKEFVPPPSTEKIEPKVQERKVKVRQEQEKTRKATPRIKMPMPPEMVNSQVDVVIPEVDIDPASINSITEKEMISTVKNITTDIDIIGVKSQNVEKVLICVDAGRYLMTDERGGLDTYKVIRDDIKKVIEGLPSTVLFNLMAYDLDYGTSINFFQRNLVPATQFNKRIASSWINPINSTLDRIGAGGNNYNLKYEFPPQPPQSAHYNPYGMNIYKVYQAAIEQGADTIYFLTTTWADPENMKMPWTDNDFRNYRRAEEKYHRDFARDIRAQGWTEDKILDAMRAEQTANIEGITKARNWIKDENAKRKASGTSLYVGRPIEAMFQNNLRPPFEGPPGMGAPPPVKYKSYGRKGLFAYYEKLFKEVYRSKGLPLPRLNIILFKGKNEEPSKQESQIIRSFANANNGGRTRALKGLRPVSEQNMPDEKAEEGQK